MWEKETFWSINYVDIISAKLKRGNPLVSFFVRNWFSYIHLIYKDKNNEMQKIGFYCYGQEYSKYWGVENRLTRLVWEGICEKNI